MNVMLLNAFIRLIAYLCTHLTYCMACKLHPHSTISSHLLLPYLLKPSPLSTSSFCFKDIFDPWKELVLPGIDLYIKSDTILNVLNSAEDAEVAIIYGIQAILSSVSPASFLPFYGMTHFYYYSSWNFG